VIDRASDVAQGLKDDTEWLFTLGIRDETVWPRLPNFDAARGRLELRLWPL